MKSPSEAMTCSEELMFRVEEKLSDRYISIAALWYEKEIEYAKVLLTKLEAKEIGTLMVSTLTDWLFNPVATRWYDPLSHTYMLRALETEAVQRIVFGRLRLLSMLPGFSNVETEELLLRLERCMAYPSNQPLMVDNTASNSVKAVFSGHTLTDQTRKYLLANHWLVLLYFAITSAQISGLDIKLLK